MSHELSFNNGKAEMAFTGETAWHGLGQALPTGATLEEWGQASNFANWKILRSKVRYAVERPDERGKIQSFAEFPEKHVLFRSDNKKPLGLVSDNYKIVQPMAVLEFFRDLTESMGFTLETAGTLFEGRKFWALARVTESVAVADAEDKIGGFLLLSTSCDGSMATQARWTTVRVVCNNTLSLARYNAAAVSINHRSEFKPQEVKERLGLAQAQEAFAKAMEQFRRMAELTLTPGKLALTTAQLMTPRDVMQMARDEVNELLDLKQSKEILHLACGAAVGSDLAGANGTMWGWLNAVTQYVDHERRAKTDSHRMDSAFFGEGDKLKNKALELAIAGAEPGNDRLAALGLRV